MNKKTKMWLGIGVVAAAAYYFYHKSKTTKAYANQVGYPVLNFGNPAGTCFGSKISCPDGKQYCIPQGQPVVCPTNAYKPTYLTKEQTKQTGRISGN
jgi:hypothetical protein